MIFTIELVDGDKIFLTILKLDEPYKCWFHHCMGEDAEFQMYNDTSGECTACQAKCTSDPSCAVVECDYFDKRNCIWQNSTNCYHSTSITLGYSKAYQTCLKPPKSKSYYVYDNLDILIDIIRIQLTLHNMSAYFFFKPPLVR